MDDQCGFLYIILTNHWFLYNGNYVQRLGYGITGNPKRRTKQYSDHSGGEQEFIKLWYGPKYQISSLENIIKQRVAGQTHKIYGQKVEWISPKAEMTVDDLAALVSRTIKEEGLNILAIKEDYLPFDNLDEHNKLTVAEINNDPEKFLDLKA
jgi:hypothetical protein